MRLGCTPALASPLANPPHEPCQLPLLHLDLIVPSLPLLRPPAHTASLTSNTISSLAAECEEGGGGRAGWLLGSCPVLPDGSFMAHLNNPPTYLCLTPPLPFSHSSAYTMSQQLSEVCHHTQTPSELQNDNIKFLLYAKI